MVALLKVGGFFTLISTSENTSPSCFWMYILESWGKDNMLVNSSLVVEKGLLAHVKK